MRHPLRQRKGFLAKHFPQNGVFGQPAFDFL
jgi:hypothetical protein